MILGTSTFLILLLALIVDRFLGDPDWLWERIPHPVVLFGNAIGYAEKQFNKSTLSEAQREKFGFVTIAAFMLVSIFLGWIFSVLLLQLSWFGVAIEVLIVAIFLAQKSLADHVRRVASGLKKDGLEGGRHAVSMIVGRNPETLDEAGVCRAAIESLAENASDGVVAPAFWYAIFGLPGLFAYKMLNTADSMIGHKTDRFSAFGKASAKFDDLANWVPARLTALFILLSEALNDIEDNIGVVWRDSKKHRSPNAGWPESAMAAVLNIALGGPRIYDGDQVDEPFMNASGQMALSSDVIEHAITVFYRAMLIATVLVGIITALQF